MNKCTQSLSMSFSAGCRCSLPCMQKLNTLSRSQSVAMYALQLLSVCRSSLLPHSKLDLLYQISFSSNPQITKLFDLTY